MLSRPIRNFCPILAICILLWSASFSLAQRSMTMKPGQSEVEALWAEIDRYAKMDDDSPMLAEALREGIEQNSSKISQFILPKLKQPELPERRLAIYVWALGVARDQMAAEDIISLCKGTKSDLIKRNSYVALANIGNEKAAAYLMSEAETAKDDLMRFGFLNYLAQMQYPAALPKSVELLKKDPKTFYWQNVFFFGKMGDKGIPFLLEKMSDADVNVRMNAIHVLGQWLVAPEAVEPMQEHFWKETNQEIRGSILSALEWITADTRKIKSFFESVAGKESDRELVKFATETLKSLKGMEDAVQSFKKEKKVSEKDFKKEYDALYRTMGRVGDYRILSISSKPEDEARLKKLRERVLQRTTDECFRDVKKINETIIFNRLSKNS